MGVTDSLERQIRANGAADARAVLAKLPAVVAGRGGHRRRVGRDSFAALDRREIDAQVDAAQPR